MTASAASSPAVCLLDGPHRLRICGDVDFTHVDDLRAMLTAVADTASSDIDIDVSELRYIDSSGIALLTEFSQRLAARNYSVMLRSPCSFLVRLLRLSGLGRFFVLDSPLPETARRPDLGPRATSWQHSRFALPCRRDLLGMGRDRLMAFARSMPFMPEERDEIELAIGEALSNAMRHGCPSPDARIIVDCEGSDQSLTVRVTDPGRGFDPDSIPAPSPSDPREGGMGLHFMRITMDEISFQFDERGTTVTLVKRIKGRESALAAAPSVEAGAADAA